MLPKDDEGLLVPRSNVELRLPAALSASQCERDRLCRHRFGGATAITRDAPVNCMLTSVGGSERDAEARGR